jgi:hypothetical protein
VLLWRQCCRVTAASQAAADRLKRAFADSDETHLLAEGASLSDAVAIEMLPVQNRLMAAEQRINAALQSAKADLASLARLQSAAQEV